MPRPGDGDLLDALLDEHPVNAAPEAITFPNVTKKNVLSQSIFVFDVLFRIFDEGHEFFHFCKTVPMLMDASCGLKRNFSEGCPW